VCREEACTPYGWVWTAAAIACCAAGMASKEVMVSVPVAVVLFDRFFLFGSFKEALRRRWKLYVGLAATWVILGIEVAYNFTRGGSAGFTGNISAWGFLQAQTVWVTRYLKLTVWPSPLVLDYGMGLITGFSRIWPYALFIVLLLGASIAAIRYRPWVGYLAILFWMILAPTSSFVPNINQTAAEHRMYLPLAPLVVLMVMAVALGWDKLLGRMKLNEDSRWLMERAVLPTVLAFVLIALGVRTVIRNEDYQSLERMWTQANRDYPDCARLLQDMGSVYLEQQRYEDALKQFQRAVEVAPDYAHGYIGRADSLFRIGQASKSESERQKLFAEAEKDYTKAIQLDPRIHTAYSNLGVMHSQWGKKQQALEDLNKAVAVNPRHTQSRISRAAVEIDLKNFKAAREDLDVVLASNPDNFMCLHMRAEVLRSQGELPRALDDANRAVRVAESMLAKLNERGRSLLAGICLTRAEIYADMGQFSKAAEDVATARQAGARPSAELARKLAASGVR
jgi:tetratricopeptide (TPR) repeat protein